MQYGKVEILYLNMEYCQITALVYVCFKILKQNSYTCYKMHLSLPLNGSSLSKHHTQLHQ